MANRYVKTGGTPASPYENWTDAADSIKTAIEAAAAGEIVYVDSAYLVDFGASQTIAPPTSSRENPVIVISVDASGNPTPPTVFKSGASHTSSTLNADLTIESSQCGIVFIGMEVRGNRHTFCGAQDSFYGFSNCTLGGRSTISGNLAFDGNRIQAWLDNIQFNWQNTLGSIVTPLNGGCVCITDAKMHASSSAITGLFVTVNNGCRVIVSNADLSGMASTGEIIRDATINDCHFELNRILLPSSGSIGDPTLDVQASINARGVSITAGNHFDVFKETVFGTVESDTAHYLDALYDEVNKYSLKLTGTSDVEKGFRGTAVRYPIWTRWLDTADPTLTVHAFGNHATQLQDDELWIEVEYPGKDSSGNTTVLGKVQKGVSANRGLSGTNVGIESDPGWTKVSATDARYYSMAENITDGAIGIYTVYVCLASTQVTYVDPAVDVT